VLVAGTAMVGAAQDGMDQFYVTASARMFEVVIRTVGIEIGIVIAVRLMPARLPRMPNARRLPGGVRRLSGARRRSPDR
jgi:Putative threonine/serine exporter